MAGKSDYLENAVLNAVFNNTSLAVTTPYVGLYTAAPTDAGGGTEVTGGSYARVSASFGAAASGAIANDVAVTFPSPTANWGTVTHFGIFDASSAGNLLYWGALDTSRNILNGDNAPSFAIGALDVTED
jgi:hypothetical protein